MPAMPATAKVCTTAMQDNIYDVFFPPKVPQEAKNEKDTHLGEINLLKMVCDALASLRSSVTPSAAVVVNQAYRAISQLYQLKDETGTIAPKHLQIALDDLSENGGYLPIHVRAQNAGIIVSRVGETAVIEFFELSPKNDAVMSTKGRLKRTFPASAVAISAASFDDKELCAALADTIARMNSQEIAEMKPRVLKSDKYQIEERDTTDPSIVTDFLATILSSLGEVVELQGIEKNTREQVCWRDAYLPWRRSPLWLLVRVTIQTIMTRANNPPLYKQFMIFFMASVLQIALPLNLANETIYCMVAKICGRLLKLERDADDRWLPSVEGALSSAVSKLRMCWQATVQDLNLNVQMKPIPPAWLEEDIFNTLPDLHKFISSIELHKSRAESASFKPTWSVPKWTTSNLPIVSSSGQGERAAFELLAFEKWAAVSLDGWVQSKIDTENTTAELLTAMQTYHLAAQCHYSKNPEGLSLMILTILELWVACDKSACAIHGLLKEYQHEIPFQLLQSLILPFKSQMERLHRVEKYLRDRQYSAASMESSSIFSSFGKPNTFGVRFFSSSPDHQNFKSHIEIRAEQEKAKKIAEFHRKQKTYHEHVAKSRETSHEFYERFDRYTGRKYSTHSQQCKSCFHEQEAANMRIEVHEWPLPKATHAAQNVVFELQVPRTFGRWRDATAYVILDVLKSKIVAASEAKPVAYLAKYLSMYSQNGPDHFVLASTTKSNRETHRELQSLETSSENDILQANGLNYGYFYEPASKWTAFFEETDQISTTCTYELSVACTSLQKFISRPYQHPNGVTPNHVISQQYECPENLSLEEFKAMATLPCGYRIQWLNALAQVHMPRLDFTNGDVLLIILQICRQVGPPDDDNLYRGGHQPLRSTSFASIFLDGLEAELERIKENWESYYALHCFIILAARMLSLSPADAVSARCLDFLCKCRKVALEWLSLLQDKAKHAEEEKYRAQFISSIFEIAQICVASFDIDECHLRHVLQSPADAAILLEACLIVHDAFSSIDKSQPQIHADRFRRVLFKSFSFLEAAILSYKSPCLDMALCKTWTGYPGSAKWEVASDTHNHWLVALTVRKDAKQPLHIQYNLLTGELLVNGFPLSRLPTVYECHPTYAVLFGRATIEVLPTDMPGMKFSSKKSHFGYTLFFGLSDSQPADLLLVAESGRETYDILPAHIFADALPQKFVNDYVHWYERSTQNIEFRHKNAPWESRLASNWVMRKSVQGWLMERQGEKILIGLQKETAKYLSRLLDPLENASFLHITFHKNAGELAINIPRLKLDFLLKSSSTRLWSLQFRGLYLDADTSIGSLTGLRSKIVLRTEHNRRKVLIPDGNPRWIWNADTKHPEISIPHGTSQKVHIYDVDPSLQRLVDNGSLQSKLVICHLHALSSSCLPDSLTGKTGTEQALSILHSASLRSFAYLEEDDVLKLKCIASLSPARAYYPERMECMETVIWDTRLSFLSQDTAFHESVRAIFAQASKNEFFYPGICSELPRLDHVDPRLEKRQAIRAASFQVHGFGAEHRTVEYDATYRGRDGLKYSNRSNRAFKIACMMLRPEKSLVEPVTFGLADTLWSVFNDITAGPVGEMKAHDICYNAKWLEDQKPVLRSHWCQMHRLLTSLPHQRRFRALLCLSTMAYAETGQLQILQILVALYRNPTLKNMIIPGADRFMVPEGRTAVQSEIHAIAQEHSFDFIQSKEYRWPRKTLEDEDEYYYRRYSAFSINKSDAVKSFTTAVHSQWVCNASNLVIKEEEYLDTFRATPKLREKWTLWYQNYCFYRYLVEIAVGLELCIVTEAPPFGPRLARPRTALPKACQLRTSKPYIDGDSFFTHTDFALPTVEKQDLKFCRLTAVPMSTGNTLAELLKRLKTAALSHYPSAEKYASELEKSFEALKRRPGPSELSRPRSELDQILQVHLNECRTNVDNIYSALQNIFQENLLKTFTQNLVSPDKCKTAAIFMAPRMSASILLGNLTRQQWQRLSLPWQKAIVLYGIALTDVQQAERLLQMNATTDFVKELSNTGHANWNPLDHPESLLLEIESGILIREVQENIAKHMRDPPKGENAIMQLNMGEGKSSVIVPIVAAHLADGSRLVRVIVAKPQAKELLRTLITKLGGLLNHRIYHMPFNRSLRLASYQIHALSEQYKECREQRGVLLCHPEHILSFKLMAIEYQSLEGRIETGNALLDLYHDFNLHTRDIVDESDENLSPRFELIYTMGVQRPIELSPDRWVLLQRVLGVVASAAISIQKYEPESIEVTHDRLGYFPRTRVLRDEAGSLLLRKVTQRVCDTGLPGLPIARQDSKMRQAIFDYIFEDDLSQDQINAVENTPFFTDTIKGPLLILRGLIAGRVLLFALKQKRWRVDYGLDVNRTPSTRLAVPYRAKDSPSLRSEFSHPDVVILLTCLSYYYQGLSDEEMFIAFAHLMRADQAEIDYNEWVSDAPDLPASFQQLGGINLKDISQVTTRVFPHLRHAKRAVDYFLSHFVFPKEMKEFSHKLSASGWDLGQQKRNATTGFSGTNDSRHVLPLEVKQLEIEEHLHTNALVLRNLLRSENKVQLLGQGESSPVDRLFDFVADTENDVHVILDVGAQVLELTNVQVARRWLQLLPAQHKQEAVVYFNDDDDLCVIDREGTSERLWISPYSDQLDRCLVFLDQAHTRGTDLKLPEYYRAAVTLGPDLTKDGLVQACMRMRKLGSGQSVVFCVSQEMQFRVNKAVGISPGSDIAVSDVLIWAIHETHANLHRVMPLWARQGVRFERQKKIWKSATKTDGIKMVQGQAEEFLEEEAKTIECRYRPSVHNSAIELQSQLGRLGLDECEEIAAIQARCDDFGVSQSRATTLQEEQEKELAPEIEQERQIERPPRAEPALHSIHKELVEFVTTGDIISNSSAILPASSALAGTSVANSSNLVQFPRALLATADYASTVKLSKRQKQIEGAADAFQRPIQWILTGCGTTGCTNAVIISPHEAQELLPLVAQSKSTHLHIYAPRSSMTLAPMDALRLYTVPKIPPGWRLPDNLRLELNLFAGQLYFSSFDDYRRTCNMLSLAWRPPMAGGVTVEADGFIATGVAMNSDLEELREPTGEVENWAKFDRSPVKSLKTLLTVLRRDCSEIDKTHWGRIIAGELLTEEDFTTDYSQV